MCNKNNCVYPRRGSRESSSFTLGLPTSSRFFLFLTFFLPPSPSLPSTPFAPLFLSLSIYLAYFLSRSSFCSLSTLPLSFSVTFCLREAPSFGLSCDSTREENMWLYPLQFHKVHSALARPPRALPCSSTLPLPPRFVRNFFPLCDVAWIWICVKLDWVYRARARIQTVSPLRRAPAFPFPISSYVRIYVCVCLVFFLLLRSPDIVLRLYHVEIDARAPALRFELHLRRAVRMNFANEFEI